MKALDKYIWFRLVTDSGKHHFVKYATDEISEAKGRLTRDLKGGKIWCIFLSTGKVYGRRTDDIVGWSQVSTNLIKASINYFKKEG